MCNESGEMVGGEKVLPSQVTFKSIYQEGKAEIIIGKMCEVTTFLTYVRTIVSLNSPVFALINRNQICYCRTVLIVINEFSGLCPNELKSNI